MTIALRALCITAALTAALAAAGLTAMPLHAAPAAPKTLGTGNSDGPNDITVAADGSGQFQTLQAGIDAAPTGSPGSPTIIHIKPGTYHELIYVQREKRYVRLIGTDPATTVVTYGLYAGMTGLDGRPIGTFRTATATIDADDFTVENVTFRNSAGPVGQAVAVRIDGDKVAFRNCRFEGWQDTILDNRGRHDYDHCVVSGAVDFIFGGGTGLFDHCVITELRDKGGDITAPSTPEEQPFGLVFLHCRLMGAPGVKPGSTGLMRPWRQYGMSAFIDCTMDTCISARGWDAWGGREKTCRAEEYGSVTPSGAPVDLSARSPWGHALTASEAAQYTPSHILGGWK
jgi:pectinesterase